MSKYAFARSLTYLLVFAGLAMTVLGLVMAVAGLLSYSAILMVPTALGIAVGGLVLALEQGGYDWGMLAFSVGFGGSMIWFGSSAGVALSNMFPEARSVGQWLRHGWFVAVAYVVGFFFMLAVLGWHPHEKHKDDLPVPSAATLAAPTPSSPVDGRN